MSDNFRFGFIDKDSKTVISPKFYVTSQFRDKTAVVKKFGKRKYSVIDREGKYLFEDAFDYFGKWSEGVLWLNEGGAYNSNGLLNGGTWRYLDSSGAATPQMQCESCYDFSGGLGGFVSGGMCGAMDKKGNVVIKPVFNFLGKFSCEIAVANQGGSDGYVDKKGEWVIKPDFEMAYDFTDDVASVKINGQIHLIDKTGKIISDGYESISLFQDGIAWVKKDGFYSFINQNGKMIKDVWVDQFKGAGQGLCGLFLDGGWYFMKKDASTAGPFEDILLPNEGLARVKKNGLWGFIDLDGADIIPPQYVSVYGFTEGFAGVCNEDEWFFIDKKGRKINDEKYDYVGVFSEDRAPVMKGGLWGLIDSAGKKICGFQFGRIGEFSDGMAQALHVKWEQEEPSYRREWTLMPKEGFSSKVFDDIGKYDVFRVIVGFSKAVEGEEYEKMTQIIYNWEYLLNGLSTIDSIFVENELFISNWNLSFLASRVFNPKKALAVLFEEFKEIGLPVIEVIFIRLCEPGDELKFNMYKKRVAIKHPDQDSGQSWFEDLPSYLNCVFDKKTPCPASESVTDLIGVKTDLSLPEGMRFEERTMPIYVPGVRICYGVVQNMIVAADDRTYEIEDGIIKSFREKYSSSKIWVYPPPKEKEEWYIPRPLRNDNSIGVEKIEHDGRKGYLFAVEPYCIEQNFSSKYFRYREQEMMEALSDVIREKNLEEVITWQRFGDVPQNAVGFAGMAWPKTPNIYEINLWEKK
ncbi:WG repeat-containing protein [candidate division WOR-3 bacterium]|nr:WG repeat-containing protein [candidate division WOR-3 bacterium]